MNHDPTRATDGAATSDGTPPVRPAQRCRRGGAVTLAMTLSVALASLGLAACEKEPPTVGQQIDAAVAQAERKAAEVREQLAATGAVARQSTADAIDRTAENVKDAAVTAAVKAELARDSGLSALAIDVDTEAGRVALNGTAPDAQARERAAALAGAVDGVRSVDNRLQIAARR